MTMDDRTRLRRRVAQNLSGPLSLYVGLPVDDLRLFANEGYIRDESYVKLIEDYYTNHAVFSGQPSKYY